MSVVRDLAVAAFVAVVALLLLGVGSAGLAILWVAAYLAWCWWPRRP